jgi:polyvinyl alcohol dehydrogenase (cytochrome)
LIRRIGTACAAVATAALIAGASFAAPASAAAPCTGKPAGGDWPVYGHDTANTRSQPISQGIGPGAVAGLKTAWVFSTASTGDNSGFESTPVVAGGCVFVGSFNGFAYGLDATSGKLVWQRKLDVPKMGFGGALVGAPVVNGSAVIYLVNVDGGPYAIALNRSTGAVLWRSDVLVNKPPGAFQGFYTNASPIVANGLVVAGYSAPEGDSSKTGGFALIDAGTGKIVKITETIPPADQAKGYAGGGLWSTPAYDPQTKYVYWGAGNPSSKDKEHPYTDAIIKIDLDRSHATFGEVVGSYEGNVDQYTDTLETLSHTPVCSATDNNSIPQPLDDPACGQLDLDFGDSANLFTNSKGEKLVGDLQKSGVYHAAHADTMKPAWSNIVGVSCQVCNAASSAYDGKSIYGGATPEGAEYALNRDDGSVGWLAPLFEPVHFQSTSVADGVVWSLDDYANLNAWDAASGKPLARRALTLDAGARVSNMTSSGVAIAQHTVFAAAGGLGTNTDTGYVLAYRP